MASVQCNSTIGFWKLQTASCLTARHTHKKQTKQHKNEKTKKTAFVKQLRLTTDTKYRPKVHLIVK